MGHIELISNEQLLMDRLEHYTQTGTAEDRLTVISTRGYEAFRTKYPNVNGKMAGGDDLEGLLAQIDTKQRLTLTAADRDNYYNALNNGELLLYIAADRYADSADTTGIVEPNQATSAVEDTIELREEHLVVNKENVNVGEVVVNKFTEEKVEEFDVPVANDNVTVERRAVKGEPLFETYNMDDSGDAEGVIRIPITKERIKITKEHVVTEEIVIRKEVVQKTEHVSGVVKHEDVNVTEVKKEELDR